MSQKTRREIPFSVWLNKAYSHGNLMGSIMSIVALLFAMLALAAFHWGFALVFVGMAVVFGLALRHRWQRELENPPWYLLEVNENDDNN